MTSSFNEWWESTNVEPSVNYGFQFLNLTGFFVAEWKYGARSSPVSITGAQTEELLLVTYGVRASLLLSMSYFFSTSLICDDCRYACENITVIKRENLDKNDHNRSRNNRSSNRGHDGLLPIFHEKNIDDLYYHKSGRHRTLD